MMNKQITDNYININIAAKFLGVSVVTLRGWIKKYNDIPVHKIGEFWKFERSELDEWVKSGKIANII